MRRNRPFAALILLMVAMIAAVTFLMFRESAGTTAPAQVYVIIESSNDNRWVQFIAGMQQAAEDYCKETGDREIRVLLLEEQDADRDGFGSDYHPNEITQRLLAGTVTDAIRKWMKI
jgi:ABC-type sugar transport system substrate-binding protein